MTIASENSTRLERSDSGSRNIASSEATVVSTALSRAGNTLRLWCRE